MSIYNFSPNKIASSILISALLVSGYSHSSVGQLVGAKESIAQPQVADANAPTTMVGVGALHEKQLKVADIDSPGTLVPVPASIELRADKTLRIRWKPSAAADYYRVLQSPDGTSGYKAISEELRAPINFFDHRVAMRKSVNARYRVEACNAGGCTLSVQQMIAGNLEDAIGYSNDTQFGEDLTFGRAASLNATLR